MIVIAKNSLFMFVTLLMIGVKIAISRGARTTDALRKIKDDYLVEAACTGLALLYSLMKSSVMLAVAAA